MIRTDQNNYERLYLHKDNENEIYIDNSQNLKQHQIDSLRFLYKQFKKKKHGGVLNFPPGSGKSFIVTLFLNAISSLLKESVLILCTDDEEINHWKQLFLTWTDYKSEEIAVESSNPRLKKKIFLKKADNLTSYLRCHWSVVVIKDEIMCKTIKKVVIEADLKIWLTSTDVKKDISLLLFIYNWMFPKSNVNVNEILSNEIKPQDKLIQSIIMNTFLDDFVIREDKVELVKETKNSEILKRYRDNQRTSKKNKDVTGTKIKKSKIINDSMKQINNIPADVCNVSTIIEPKPEISGNNLTEMEINDNTVCDKDIDLGINTVQVKNDIYLQENLTHTSNTERDTEELDFKKAIEDIEVNENMAHIEENSTESLDFGVDNTESIIDNKNILDIENNASTYEDKPLDNISNNKNIESNIQMDLDTNRVTTEKSECNDLDYKMSELEARTLKKFKGSLLDSIF